MLRKFYLSTVIVMVGFLFLGWAEAPTTIAAGGGAVQVRPTTTDPSGFTKETCSTCHEDQVASFDNTTHARAMHTVSSECESCHGDATQHVENGGGEGTMRNLTKLSPSEANQVCLNCHEKSGNQSHASMSEHTTAGVTCTTCHEVHVSGESKLMRASHGQSAMLRGAQSELCTSCHKKIDAEFSKPTHHRLQEGVMECSSCHNPHGTAKEKQLLADNKENCLKCHEEKRGPFAFEHDAGNIDGCLGCHQPHGSSGPHMLKARDERTLCVSCHSKETGVATPHSRLGLQATGDCTRCHSEIHGSHSDPYFTH